MIKFIYALLLFTTFFTNLVWSKVEDNLEHLEDKYMHALSLLHDGEFETKQDLLRQQLKVSSLANEYFSVLKQTNLDYSDAEFAVYAYENRDYANAEKFSANALNSLTLVNMKLQSTEFFDLKMLNLKSRYLDAWHKKKAGKRVKSTLNLSFFNELIKDSIIRDDNIAHFQLEEDLIIFILDLPSIKLGRDFDIWYDSNVDKEIVRLNYHKNQLKNIRSRKLAIEYEHLKRIADQVKLGNYNFNTPGKSYFYLGQYYFLLGKFKIGKEFMEQSLKYSKGNQDLIPIFKMANLYMLNLTEGRQQDSSNYWMHTAMESGSEIIYKPFMYYDFGLIKEDISVGLQLKINKKGYVTDIGFIDKKLDVYVSSFIEEIMKQSRFSPYIVNGELKAHSNTVEFMLNKAYNKPKNKTQAKRIQLLSQYYPKSILTSPSKQK
jgi:hypothetical protein